MSGIWLEALLINYRLGGPRADLDMMAKSVVYGDVAEGLLCSTQRLRKRATYKCPIKPSNLTEFMNVVVTVLDVRVLCVLFMCVTV